MSALRKIKRNPPWFLIVIPLIVLVVLVIKHNQFERKVSGHLERSARASTIFLARMELDYALDGIKELKLTEGQTHILLYTPDHDLGFWNRNLQDAHDELARFPANADEASKATHLLKLKEVLLEGNSARYPPNILLFPNQLLWTSLLVASLIVGVFGLTDIVTILIESGVNGKTKTETKRRST